MAHQLTSIVLDNVAKRYRWEWIFKSLSYRFDVGEHYAITGHNGAGKSTLMQLLMGYLTPSLGTCSFLKGSKPIDVANIYTQVSFAAPYVDLIEELTLEESLSFHQQFKPFLSAFSMDMLRECIALPRRAWQQPLRFFSSGMKQRVKLALSILSDTPVLLLDEPTITLDRLGIDWYQQLIQEFSKDRLVIIASNVEEDYHFCKHRVSILDYKPTVSKV